MENRLEQPTLLGLAKIQTWFKNYVDDYVIITNPNGKGILEFCTEVACWGIQINNTLPKKFLSKHPNVKLSNFLKDSTRKETLAILGVFYARGIIQREEIESTLNTLPFISSVGEFKAVNPTEWQFLDEGLANWDRRFGAGSETLEITAQSRISFHKARKKAISTKGWLFISALLIVLALLTVFLLSSRSSQSVPEAPEINERWVIQTGQFHDINMVFVPAGCFIMGYNNGAENERPADEVCLDAFWLSKTEITNGQFGGTPDPTCNANQVDNTKPSVNGTGDLYPHNCVTWEEAFHFCESIGMRLPTEAEWEWAARGPSEYLFPWGNDFEPYRAVVRTDIINQSAAGTMREAGSVPEGQSWVGALDMAGSLREWTSTIYDEQRYPYPYDSDDGRENSTNEGIYQDGSATIRVVRGGSFDDAGGDRHRLTRRYIEWYDFRFNIYGFRCAMDFESE